MDIVRFGESTSFGALKPGACFAFEEDDSGKLGLKLAGESCVVLGREPPALRELSADTPVFQLADAKFMPSPDPSHLRAGKSRPESGNALLCGERLLLLVETPSGGSYVDVQSGAIVPDLAAVPTVIFTAWRIVQKWLDDEYHTLCLYETRGQKTLGFQRRP